jgi:HPt (histidine-containing phosphotransfer) domain-containing protein
MLVDDALALERMGGMPELLARISQAYARTLPRELALWRQCWAAGDTEQALRVLHTLKGTAASLGALPLAQALRELEEACRDATDTAPTDTAGIDTLAAHLEDIALQCMGHWLGDQPR